MLLFSNSEHCFVNIDYVKLYEFDELSTINFLFLASASAHAVAHASGNGHAFASAKAHAQAYFSIVHKRFTYNGLGKKNILFNDILNNASLSWFWKVNAITIKKRGSML